jgi:hypothetical protein
MPSIGSTRIDDTSSPGQGIVIVANDSLTVSALEVVVLSEVVPTGKTWKLQYAEVACRGYGRWKLTVDSIVVGGGLTNALKDHDRTDLPDFFYASTGQTVEVIYLYSHGPASIPIDIFIGAVEI